MADEQEKFDLENPKLPKWVKKRALTSGGFPYEEKIDDDQYAALLAAAGGQASYMSLMPLANSARLAASRTSIAASGTRAT